MNGTRGQSGSRIVAALALAASTCVLAAQAPEERSPEPAIAGAWTSVALSMGLPAVAESRDLVDAGTDLQGRPLRLARAPGAAWQAMRAAARADGVTLAAISGFRSRAQQAAILRRKLARGMPLREALSINAAPGFSEHHGGHALDIGTPGSPPAEEAFENTAAFRWLQRHAQDYGFSMSYPRDNPFGIRYEPWHWAWRESRVESTDTQVVAVADPASPAEPSPARIAQATDPGEAR